MAKRQTRPVTIVVPVYGDWPSLEECIDSLKRHVAPRHRVLLVNDCGPQADLMEKNIKKAIAGSANFSYARNPQNLGFVRNCNRAVLELDQTDNDILLLNSDTVVTAGFLEEMSAVLHLADRHGVVSPRSNNATICTVPLSASGQKGIEPQKSYAIFQKLKGRLPRYNEAPVAHGFCMLIRREVIERFGLFDEAFGQGYGEEVDLCLRIREKGHLSLIANRAFVFHREARSFSLEAKAEMIKKSSRIIDQRYPFFKAAVQDYFKAALGQEAAALGTGSNPAVKRLKEAIRRRPRLHASLQAVRSRLTKR